MNLIEILIDIKKQIVKLLDDHKANIGTSQASQVVNTQISVPNGTLTNINELTVTNSGMYLAIAQATWAQNAKGYRYLCLQRYYTDTSSYGNLGNVKYPVVSESTMDMQVHSLTPLRLSAGDKIRLVATHNAGSTINIFSSFIVLIRLK